MLQVVSTDLWGIIRRKAAISNTRRVAIAYVTDPELLYLRSGDLLITDASDTSIASGRTSASVLAKYLDAGVKLFCLSTLHAKVLILDDWAIVGSANASQNSVAVYVEAAIITDRPELVGQTDKLLSFLADTSVLIDKTFIDRILQIPVIRSPHIPTSPRGKALPLEFEQRFWFVSIPDDEHYIGNADKVDDVKDEIQRTISKKSGIVDWFWCGHAVRFCQKAQAGDVIIDCWRPHRQMISRRSVWVYKHARIVKIFQEKGINAKIFLCVYPPDTEKTAISWASFQKLAQHSGIKRKLTPSSIVELTAQQSSALFELWPE